VAAGVLSERAGVLGALALALQESEDDTGDGAHAHMTKSENQYPLAG